MIDYFKDFLINLFLVSCPLIFYPYLYKLRYHNIVYHSLLYLLFAIALVATMSFPVKINQLNFDFRIIPLTVGSLYGGIYVSLFLYVGLAAYRFILGNPNQFIYLVVLFPTFLIMAYAIKKYESLTLLRKIVVAICLCLGIRNISLLLYLSMTGNLPLFFDGHITITLIVQSLITGLYVYFFELLVRSLLLKEEIIRSEKIKIVSDIAASVAHEIRNPLTAVRGFIQLLGNENSSQERKNFYQRVCLEELYRAEQIISDYLALAKQEPQTVESIDVAEELQYVTTVLSSYANLQNTLIASNAEEQPLRLTGDRFKFRQALINIGKNAIEAMTNGGVLTFEARKISQQIVLSITDSGVGMSTEQIDRLGTPYYSTKDKGTGLGTMVSFGIIKKMEGAIDIKSEIGKGTTYTISFPARNK